MFSVTPIGTNGLYPTKDNPTSGYLIKCGNLNILVDVGSGVFNGLCSIMDPCNLDFIILTHYHFDHVSDIGVLSYYLQTKSKVITVYAPDDDSQYQKLILNSPYFNFKPIKDFKSGDLTCQFYKVNHPVLAYGVSFYYQGKKFSYTGDTNLCDNLDLLLQGCDLAICDSGFTYKDWSNEKPHLSAYHIGLLAKKHNIKVLLTHLHPNADKKQVLDEARSQHNNCFLAEHIEYTI